MIYCRLAIAKKSPLAYFLTISKLREFKVGEHENPIGLPT